MRRDEEMEAFKVRINLSEYAASRGYFRDRKKSSPNCCVMKRASGDGIVVGKAQDGHWIYYAIGDEADSGSIVDFLQNRGGGNLGRVRKALRPWLDGSASAPMSAAPDTYSLALQPSTKDLLGIQGRLAAMASAQEGHGYLERERGIPGELLGSRRFAGRVLADGRGNAVFPHRNRSGPCGYEIKNSGFTGFSPGGEKALWFSSFFEEDSAMVVAETAIDALSYAALKGVERSRFFSVAGSMSAAQPELLLSAAERMEGLQEIRLATDNDEAGAKLAERLGSLFSCCEQRGVRVVVDRPEVEGTDWNDVLRAAKA